LLLAHAQSEGTNVRALKPFSTGDGGDEALLGSLQAPGLTIAFFRFPEPISPWSAAKIHNSPVTIDAPLRLIREHQSKCDLLLIEGAGGLLTPLGEKFSAAELIAELGAEVIIVAANRLGVLNHTLLTAEALKSRAINHLKIALVEHPEKESDFSRNTNLADLKELLPGIAISRIPFLKNYRPEAESVRSAAKDLRPTLRALLEPMSRVSPA
jgi:dethiobiotin synthetase